MFCHICTHVVDSNRLQNRYIQHAFASATIMAKSTIYVEILMNIQFTCIWGKHSRIIVRRLLYCEP